MITARSYATFLQKRHHTTSDGFSVRWMPGNLFPFQETLVEYAVNKGRAALFEDCGLGKTVQQLTWAENVIQHTNKPVLLLTPIAVGEQTCREAAKFGIEAERARHGTYSGEARVVVTNYEQVTKFDPAAFGGIVCDESSAIKNFKGQRKAEVTEFCRQVKYRLLCTATAAPNDFWELGTSSEALGYLGFRDMITMFFKQETSKDHLGWGRTKYRFRGHAEQPFWRWVCSWARAIRRPSDIGGDDTKFQLPPLIQTEHVVETKKTRDGLLFAMPAMNLQEQREERRNSITERCSKAAELTTNHDGATVLWCELNDESKRLTEAIPGAVELRGNMRDEQKEEILLAFTDGEISRLVTKPKIGCWGLNWQHCHNIVSFPSHSFEQHYQAIRRCLRFGQKNAVTSHLVVNEGELGVLQTLERKQEQAGRMFDSLVANMANAQGVASVAYGVETEKVPSWL